MTDHAILKVMLERAGYDVVDEEAGLPRRHFLVVAGTRITFVFEPDGSLARIDESDDEPLM